MPSTAQVVATSVVFDYLLDTAGNGIPNKTIRVRLNYQGATALNPLVTLSSTEQTGTTDNNGYWQVPLVPNTNIGPANTTYNVETPLGSYDITVGAAGPYQSTAVGTLVNAPAPLAPATSNLTGPLTVAGLLTAQAGLAVTGGLTTDTLILSAAGITMPGPLTLTAPASRLISGATSFSIRDTGNANDNLIITNAGVATIRAGLTITAGGLVVTAGGATIGGDLTAQARILLSTAVGKIVPGGTSLSLRNNADAADNLIITDAGAATLRNTLTITAGGANVTGNLVSVTQLIARGSPSVTNDSADLVLTGTPSVRLSQAYKARAYLGANHLIGSGAWQTPVNLDTKSFDTNTNFNTGTHLWTCPVTGTYDIEVAAQHAATSGRIGARINKNSGTILASVLLPAHASGNCSVLVSSSAALTAGDTIGLDAFQETGGNTNVLLGTSNTYLSITAVSIP